MDNHTLDADKMLDIYIYDYLLKKKHNDSARIFLREARVPPSPAAINTPGGFLFEWWSVFWDVFISRYKRLGPTKEVLQHFDSFSEHSDSLRYKRLGPTKEESHVQMPQQLSQQHSQQKWLDQTQMLVDHQNRLRVQDLQQQKSQTQLRPSSVNRNPHCQKLGMLNALAKRKLEESRSWPVQQRTFADERKKRKCSENDGLVPDLMHALVSRAAEGREGHSGQLIHNTPAGNTMINQNQVILMYQNLQSSLGPTSNLNTTSSDGSFYRANVTGPPVNDFPLERWPLKVFQPQLPKSNQFDQLHVQPIEPGKLSEYPMCQPPPGDQGVGASGTMTNHDAGSWTSVDSNQDIIYQTLGKGIHPSICIDHASSMGNTVGLTSGVLNITPSTQAAAELMTLPALPLDDSLHDAPVSTTAIVDPKSSEANQVADLDKFVSNECVVDNADSFMHSSNSESDNTAKTCLDAGKDVTFVEVGTIPADLVIKCDFSLDGKHIASCANDEKIVIWCTDSKEKKRVMDEHSGMITDIRFGPRLSRIATSSYDRTVKIWNVNNPAKPLKTLKGHPAAVMSLDFHPMKDLICSCDSVSSIRYWNVQSGGCTGVSRGGANLVRFQPSQGKYLAAAVQNIVSIIDVDTAQSSRLPLKGHNTNILSICWNASGDHLISLSEDLIRVWKFGRGEVKDCIYELSISDKAFNCCVFHPRCPSLLVVGSDQSLELWDMAENKMVNAISQQATNLAVSQFAGLVASAGNDGLIKIWK